MRRKNKMGKVCTNAWAKKKSKKKHNSTRQNKCAKRQNLIFITFLLERTQNAASHLVCVCMCNTFDDENCFHHGFLRILYHTLSISFAYFRKICSQFGYAIVREHSFSLSLSHRTIFKQKIKRTLYQNASFVCTSIFVTQKDVCIQSKGYCGFFFFLL